MLIGVHIEILPTPLSGLKDDPLVPLSGSVISGYALAFDGVIPCQLVLYSIYVEFFMLWCIAGSHARPDLQCIRVWLVVDNAVVHNYLPITAAHKTLQTRISVGAAQCMPFSPGAGPKPFTPSSLCKKKPLMESINWLVGAWKLSLSAYLLILLAVSFPSIFCLFSGSK